MLFALCLSVWVAVVLPTVGAGEDASLARREFPIRKNEIVEHPLFSPDSKTLAVFARHWVADEKDYQHAIALFDVARGAEILRFTPQRKGYPSRSLFSPDGRTLAVFGWEGPVVLWDVREGSVLRELEGSNRVCEMVSSHDGKRLVARVMRPDGAFRRHNNSVLVVWDAATGKRLWQIDPGDQGEIRAFALAADGEHVLLEHHWLAGRDPQGRLQVPFHVQVRAWHVPTGRDLGAIGDVTEYSGWGETYFSSGATLHRVGAAGDGYCSQGDRGVRWAAWKGRLGVTQAGKVVLFPDYRTPNPVRFGVYLDALLDPATEKPLHELGAFYKAHQHGAALAPDGEKAAVVEFPLNEPCRLFVWDVAALARKVRPRQEPIEGRELALWNALAHHRTLADAAMRALAADPARSVPLLRERMRPIAANQTTDRQIRQWIGDLDSDEFAVREAADQELARLGALAKPFLEKGLEGKPSLEARRRITDLLQRLNQPIPAEELRGLRGVDVLEQINTAEARQVLKSLGGGAKTASLTRAAEQALTRLANAEPER
jgi:hypothetical protein